MIKLFRIFTGYIVQTTLKIYIKTKTVGKRKINKKNSNLI